MSPKAIKTLSARSRREWRSWLEKHHDRESEIWLVFPKRHTGVTTLSYDDSVEEALCFGWVDSLIRRLDDDQFARKFTPRKPDSRWSTINRRRYESLASRGLLAEPGRKRPPTNKSGDAPRPSLTALPSYLTKALNAHPRAKKFFDELAPSHRRLYIMWIDSAKREETKDKRLREALRMLTAGQKIGLK